MTSVLHEGIETCCVVTRQMVKNDSRLLPLSQVLAKDLVRTRNYVTKFIEFRSHLQGVGLKLETVRSHEAMAGAMKDVTKAMVSLNKQVLFRWGQRPVGRVLLSSEGLVASPPTTGCGELAGEL